MNSGMFIGMYKGGEEGKEWKGGEGHRRGKFVEEKSSGCPCMEMKRMEVRKIKEKRLLKKGMSRNVKERGEK